MKTNKEPVRIRYKLISGGRKSIYLDIYANGVRRYEFLKLYLLPDTRANKQKNDETMRLANAVKAKRVVELQNGRFGFESTAPKISFFTYFQKVMQDRCKKNEKSSERIWKGALMQIRRFERRKAITLAEITPTWLSAFKTHLKAVISEVTGEHLSRNTQSAYYSKLVAVLNSAEREELININPVRKVVNVRKEQTERTFLTIDEVRKLSQTSCENNAVRKAFLFSCLTGLRRSDVEKLKWSDVDDTDNGCMIVFRQKKTKELEYMFISAQARKLMGERGADNAVIFPLPALSNVNKHLSRWAKDAGIKKHITFHCARHTFATMMLTLGNDIYTTSKLLGHRSIMTTQIYAKIVDEKKKKAVESIPDISC